MNTKKTNKITEPVKTLQEIIDEIRTNGAAAIEQAIEQAELAAAFEGAKADLKATLDANETTYNNARKKLIDDFETKYGKPFEPKEATPAKKKFSFNEKGKMISELLTSDGKPKYQYKDGEVIGAKGEPVTSTINWWDADDNKQTFSVSAYTQWCKHNLK